MTAQADGMHQTYTGESAMLRVILDTVPDAMVVVDDRGRIVSFSVAAERLFGYTPAEVQGHDFGVLMPRPTGEQTGSGMGSYLGTGCVVMGQRRNGSTFPMQLSVGEVWQDGSRLFTGFIRDLTERQQTQTRLQELQEDLVHASRLRAMGQMAAALSHELNQPLTATTNYLSATQRMLDQPVPDMARIRQAVTLAAQQTQRSGEIIRRLRAFVSRGAVTRQNEAIGTLIEEASELGLVGARQRDVIVRLNAGAGLPPVLADRVQVQQVLVNLIRNAVEAMETSAERILTVEALLWDTMVVVAVSDTGTGIPPSIEAQLFQPFVTTKREGMGIGLSVCRTIVEAHGGRLWVEPNPSGGSIFRFTLPIAPEPAVES